MNLQISISREKKFSLEYREIQFFYPYLFRFINKYGIKINASGNVPLTTDMSLGLTLFFELAIKDLLLDCYSTPTNRARQKHPTRYEKVSFGDSVLTVDYTTSVVGRLIYLFSWRIRILNEAINDQMNVTLEIENLEEEYFFPV